MRIRLAAAPIAALVAALCLAAVPTAASPLPPAVAKALADPARSQAARDADAIRLPGETLAFVGIKPGMTVIELYPGGGYFTRPLSELVGDKGQVVAVETTRWKGGVA